MIAMPSSQLTRRTRRNKTRASKPVAWLLLAAMRWHIEDVAVQSLAATASKIAASISLPFRYGPADAAWPNRRKAALRNRYGSSVTKPALTADVRGLGQ